MKYLRFKNRILNLELITSVRYLPPTPTVDAELTIRFNGCPDHVANKDAAELWEILIGYVEDKSHYGPKPALTIEVESDHDDGSGLRDNSVDVLL